MVIRLTSTQNAKNVWDDQDDRLKNDRRKNAVQSSLFSSSSVQCAGVQAWLWSSNFTNFIIIIITIMYELLTCKKQSSESWKNKLTTEILKKTMWTIPPYDVHYDYDNPLPFGHICLVVLVMKKGGESSWSGPWHIGCTSEVSFSMCTTTRTSSYSPVGQSVLFNLGLHFVYLYCFNLFVCRHGYYVAGPPLLNGRCTSLLRAPVSEMTYTVLSGTLNPSIPYHTLTELWQFSR